MRFIIQSHSDGLSLNVFKHLFRQEFIEFVALTVSRYARLAASSNFVRILDERLNLGSVIILALHKLLFSYCFKNIEYDEANSVNIIHPIKPENLSRTFAANIFLEKPSSFIIRFIQTSKFTMMVIGELEEIILA